MESTMVGPTVAGIGMLFFVLLVLLSSAVLAVIPFWKICAKAGFPAPLSFLMLVPVANIILPFYIAFAEWPALKNQHGNTNQTYTSGDMR